MKGNRKTQSRRVTLSFDVTMEYENVECLKIQMDSLANCRMPKFDIEGVDPELGYYSIKSIEGSARVS